MTNGYVDIKNTDMMLIMGGNPAENHPCGFKWAIEAKRNRNAKMIVVDPRFTRTAATADLFLQIRAGADIAFLGGMHPLRHREQSHRPRLPGQLHQRRLHRQRRLQACRRWIVLGFRCGHPDLR
jgi:formylmethanofuran dehydrogenase subunit B